MKGDGTQPGKTLATIGLECAGDTASTKLAKMPCGPEFDPIVSMFGVLCKVLANIDGGGSQVQAGDQHISTPP